MKKAIKVSLVALMAVCSTTLYAQKFGRINYQELIQAMPEMETVRTQIETASAEFQEQLEGLEVEMNKKIDELQKAPATMSDSVKQLKTREIQDLQTRLQEFYETANQSLSNMQYELLAPLEEKANAAIKKVCKAEGIVVAFQTGAVIYIDEDTTIDILPKVKAEMGIK